jgi:hypothetical protein
VESVLTSRAQLTPPPVTALSNLDVIVVRNEKAPIPLRDRAMRGCSVALDMPVGLGMTFKVCKHLG